MTLRSSQISSPRKIVQIKIEGTAAVGMLQLFNYLTDVDYVAMPDKHKVSLYFLSRHYSVVPKLSLLPSFPFFFCGTGDKTHKLVLAKQAPYATELTPPTLTPSF